jgi:glycosyltransferase involved in cell wall biosynthesis
VPFPTRGEYRLAAPLSGALKARILSFRPNVVHVSAPDILGCSAVNFARETGIACVASVHTRFETYFRYYGLSLAEPLARYYLRWLYNRCRQVYVPSQCMADILKTDGITSDIRFWRRGVDSILFTPRRRDMAWRRAAGIADEDVVIAFVGRVVMEKGLVPFAATVETLERQGVSCRVLVVGDGPAAPWFRQRLPKAIFTGSLSGPDLATAFASCDIFFNPSVTETLGNVNLEAMASGLPIVAARASGSASLVADGLTGFLAPPGDTGRYAALLARLVTDRGARARMGGAGVAKAETYDWDGILGEMTGHYLEVIAPSEAPGTVPQALPVRTDPLYPLPFESRPGISK